ncbi:MAG: hypothetical protein KAT31_14075, partial [Bacteroidales bacterium]|nr:hypothetical protein [Bacteroidales bacterium]
QSWAGLFKEQILCELPVKNRNPIDSHYYWGQDAMKKPTKGHIGEDAPVRMSLRYQIYPKIPVNTERSESKVLIP